MDFTPQTLNNIEADVYYGNSEKDSYFVKITFVGIGLYINSFSVMPSQYGGYWVQPPKHRQKKGYTATVDFDKSCPLWDAVERKAIEAVELYKGEQTPYQTTKANSDTKDYDKPVALDDLPF